MDMLPFIILYIVIFLFFILIIIAGVRLIGPTERGLLLVNGQYRGLFKPGFRIAPPFRSRVIKIDLSDHSWKNKFREKKEEIPLDIYEFENLEKILEKEAAEIQTRIN